MTLANAVLGEMLCSPMRDRVPRSATDRPLSGTMATRQLPGGHGTGRRRGMQYLNDDTSGLSTCNTTFETNLFQENRHLFTINSFPVKIAYMRSFLAYIYNNTSMPLIQLLLVQWQQCWS